MRVAVGLLAGGLSSRMGFKKEAAPFRGRPLIRALTECLSSMGYDVYVAISKGQAASFSGALPPSAHLMEDEFPIRSPLNGLYTLLKGSRADCLFLMGGDSPFLSGSLISDSVDLCGRGFSAVLPMWRGGGVDCAHGAYSSSSLGELELRLRNASDLSIMSFVRSLGSIAFLEAERYWPALADVDSRAEWVFLRGLHNGRGCASGSLR